MAKVIDRLRVQGISPSREGSFSSREEAMRPLAVPNPQPDKSWIPNGNGFCMISQRQSKDFLTSNMNPAARRAEVLLRMRTANNGLSTMDSNFGPSSVQFVLRGKHVRNKSGKPLSPESCKLLQDRTLPSHRPPTKDIGLERQIKVHIGKASSEPVRTAAGADRENKESKSNDDTSLPSFASPFVLLEPSQPPSYRASFTPGRTTRSSEEGFELTGRSMKGPEKCVSRSGLNDLFPHSETPTRTHRRRTRTVFKDTPASIATSNPQKLNQCLHVHQSIRLPLGTQGEAMKLKHFTQFVKKEATANYNNPYRKLKRKERISLPKSDPRYQFNSVSSYIHFNRIYQQPAPGSSVAVHIPQMTGFPAHCTDTVLLRMMLEMNKPTRKTPDKYSDVGVQRDLEEYLMVRTPSAFSKAASALSKKTGRNKSGRSGRSTAAAAAEKGDCEWAGNLVRDNGKENGEKEEEEIVEKQPGMDEDVANEAEQEEENKHGDVLKEKVGEEPLLRDDGCDKPGEAEDEPFLQKLNAVQPEEENKHGCEG